MNPTNGHAASSAGELSHTLPAPLALGASTFDRDALARLFAELEVPFDPSVTEWRVISTTRDKKRGLVAPYADWRAYSDRLNALLTPSGWTREFTVHTSANFQRKDDQKTSAKVIVTCKVTLFGINSHSSTGEQWADDPNCGTFAESQAAKRACSCFGLGRYLYEFDGIGVDLDEKKRPKKLPRLPEWATPEGWRRGLRPPQKSTPQNGNSVPGQPANVGSQPLLGRTELIRRIEAFAEPIGKAFYSRLLRKIGGKFKAAQVQNRNVLHRILRHMEAAARGTQRLNAALEAAGDEALGPVLDSLKLRTLNQVSDLRTLHAIVTALEAKAGIKS